jgi:hypothetical protein
VFVLGQVLLALLRNICTPPNGWEFRISLLNELLD